MLLEDLQGLTTEEKFRKAAEFSGVPADVLERQWATESGKGKALVGPETKYGRAKGHFQFIDATAKSFEGRLGVKYDYKDFDIGLLFASHQWKENMTRYGDVATAAAAYHGGTDKANWGPLTKDYVAKLTGGDVPKVALGKTSEPAVAGFERLPGGLDETGMQQAAFGATMADAERLSAEPTRQQSAAVQAALAAEHARVGSKGLTDVLQTSWASPDDMATRWMLDAMLRPAEVAPDGWSYATAAAEAEKGRSDEEREELREEGRSPAAVQRVLAMQDQRRKDNLVYRDAGTFNMLLGRLAVGAVDPASLAAGFGIGKALKIAKLGHEALTAAGKGGAAAGALVAENVIGNVAIEGMMDASGKVSSAQDYAFAVGAAALITAPFTRGVYRKAADNALIKAADDLQTRAIVEDPKTLTVEERQKAVDEQARVIRDTVTTKNEDADKAVPENLRRLIEEEAGEVEPPAPPKVKKAKKKKKQADKPAEPEPMDDAEVTKWFDEQNKLALTEEGSSNTAKALDALLTDPRFQLDKLSEVNQNRVSELWQAVEAKKAEGTVHEGAHPDPALSLTTDGKPLIVSNGYFGGRRSYAKVKREIEVAKANGLGVSKYDEYLLHALDPKNVLHTSNSREVLTWLAAKGKQKSAVGKPITALDKHLGAMADVLLKIIPDTGLENTPITFSRHGSMPDSDVKNRGAAYSVSEQIFVPVTEGGKASLDDTMRFMVQHGRHTALHEIVHGVTVTLMNHVDDIVKGTKDIGNLNPKVVEAYKGLNDVMLRLKKSLPKGQHMGSGRGYATLNIKEFVAQLLSDRDTAEALINLPASKGWGGKFSTAFHEAVGMVKQLLGFEPHPTGNTAYDEAVYHLEQLLIRRDVPINGPHSTNPAWPGNAAPPAALPSEYLDAGLTIPDVPGLGPRNPQAVAIGRRKFAAAMYDHARDFMSRNPINMEKLKVFTAKFGAASDGLVLATSKNPICQMVASLITETTTGAAGRKVTAALRRESLYRKLMGNSLLDYDGAYKSWSHTNGGGFTNDILNGEARRKFDKAVYTEVLNRRTNGGVMSNGVDPAVGRAVMALEGAFERALKAQVGANTLGSKRLPSNSVGYIPQALDGQKLAVASEAQIKALTDHLSSHWVQSGFTKDKRWARDFSIFYVDRARARAMGQKGVDVTAQSTSPSDVIRDTLKAMRDVTRDPDTLSAITKAEAGLSTIGLGQTKRKLDVDLMAQLPGGQQVMDFYETDVSNLLRRYMSRTAGTVALTEFGVHGATGARHMRDAIMATTDNPAELATRKELEAFDRVMSEMLGTPVEGAVNSQVATNLRMLTSIQRLGGTVYNQFAETFQIANHLGFSSLLGGVGSLPRMMGEVGRLKRGGAAGNHILTSIEKIGGEIGMDNFKLVMPLDAPDVAQRAYGKDQGLLARLLSAGQHAQSKVTFFRGLMAAQHRATAEQITLRALRFAKESKPGEVHVNLQDMGFDPDLVDHIRNNLGRIARYDANGDVTHLDITQLPNPKAAEEFVAAVHRGTMQIIQGTFIGERSAWLHNDWMKLMLQMRTFGLTAVEKQWGRTRMNHGYARATGLLLGSMAMAVPVHLARVHAASLGREDHEEFVKKNLSPYAVLRATMNYASLTGVAGDVLDVTAGIGGGWSDEVAETVGAQAGTQGAVSVSRLVPSVGSLDAAGRVVGGKADLYTALKQLPGSNIPFIVPLINLTK